MNYYEKFHKWPKGFKKKLANYYGFENLRCVLCWTYSNVAVHHLELNVDENHSIIFDDLSMFVPLCKSCHGKIEAIIGHYPGNGKPPIYYLMKGICQRVKDMHK